MPSENASSTSRCQDGRSRSRRAATNSTSIARALRWDSVYGRSYLERKYRVAFDPVELTLQGPPFRTTKLRGNFGALRDSSPDAWGRKFIEARWGNTSPTEIQHLINPPDDRAGALSFGLNVQPPASSQVQPDPRSGTLDRRRQPAPTPSRPRRRCAPVRRWVARGRRQRWRTNGHSGWQTFLIRMTGGTIRASHTLCWPWPASAGCHVPKAG